MMGIIIEKGTKKNGCHTCHLLAEKPRKRRGEKNLEGIRPLLVPRGSV